ncbi:hypothetical protein F5I97DRAFT_1930982 [Phlebopus sp. FC_14]|nr:hypothetical protein F5I97DRAFT_1930982 [Phlebopus sp. FC_14]
MRIPARTKEIYRAIAYKAASQFRGSSTHLQLPVIMSGKEPDVIIAQPTLGYPARVGELYDERKGRFLGVQLYSDSKMSDATTSSKTPESKLFLNTSTSFQEKQTMLDIDAHLAVEILGGMATVSGSASYLTNSNSTTEEKAWSLRLQVRTKEETLEFTREELGRNALKVVMDDYIATDLATHFVSTVAYGGDVIVNLVAVESELTEEDKIEGHLEAEMQFLQGAISVEGEIDLEKKEELKRLNNKFSLALYGDIALNTVPVNAQDVLDTFHDSRELIGENGVPMKATLQPIPEELRQEAILVYHLEKQLLDSILRVFGDLDDIQARFSVLQNGIKIYNDIIPTLGSVTRSVATKFAAEHSELLQELKQFISNSQMSGLDPNKGQELVDKAEQLYQFHANAPDTYEAPSYPSHLKPLERAFSDFQAFTLVLRDTNIVSTTLQPSSLKDVSWAVWNRRVIPLFLMSPLFSSESSSPTLLLARFFALLQANARGYLAQKPPIPCSVLYVEDPVALETQFPNDGHFLGIVAGTAPAFYEGSVDLIGMISWILSGDPDDVAGGLVYDIEFNRATLENGSGQLAADLNLDASASFTVMARGVSKINMPGPHEILLQLADVTGTRATISINPHVSVFLEGGLTLSDGHTKPEMDKSFWVVFVQDSVAGKYILYMDGKKLDEKAIDAPWRKLSIVGFFPNKSLMDGWLYNVQAYSATLTQDQIHYLTQNSHPSGR